MTTVQGQKVKGQGHKVTHKKFTQSRALALVTLESNRPLVVTRQSIPIRWNARHESSESYAAQFGKGENTGRGNARNGSTKSRERINTAASCNNVWSLWLRIVISLQSYLLSYLLFVIGIPSPAHSFTLGLNPYFSANPPYRSLSFFFFQVSLYGFPRLFTVTSAHIRLFTF